MSSKYKIIPLSELPLHSDFMFGQVMRSEGICKLFLEALLGVSIQRIEYLDMQKDFTDSYEYHSIRLDVYLKDDKGTVFNVEIQAERRDELPKRVRFYQSGIDRGELPKGADYANLSESYIVFVCNFDYFHIGKAVGECIRLRAPGSRMADVGRRRYSDYYSVAHRNPVGRQSIQIPSRHQSRVCRR